MFYTHTKQVKYTRDYCVLEVNVGGWCPVGANRYSGEVKLLNNSKTFLKMAAFITYSVHFRHRPGPGTDPLFLL
jgi:hypothetical protein